MTEHKFVEMASPEAGKLDQLSQQGWEALCMTPRANGVLLVLLSRKQQPMSTQPPKPKK